MHNTNSNNQRTEQCKYKYATKNKLLKSNVALNILYNNNTKQEQDIKH